MKKIFLLITICSLTFGLNSCSKSDDGNESRVSLKVNGVTKSFSKIFIDDDGGDLYLYGYIGSEENPTDIFSMSITRNETGANALNAFSYTNDDDVNYYSSSDFTTNISTNNSSKVTGTFSGTFISFDLQTNVIITQGTFDIKL